MREPAIYGIRNRDSARKPALGFFETVDPLMECVEDRIGEHFLAISIARFSPFVHLSRLSERHG